MAGIGAAFIVFSGPSQTARALLTTAFAFGCNSLFFCLEIAAATPDFARSPSFRELVRCGYPVHDMACGIWGASLRRAGFVRVSLQVMALGLVWAVLIATDGLKTMNSWGAMILVSITGLVAFETGSIFRAPESRLSACALRLKIQRMAIARKLGHPTESYSVDRWFSSFIRPLGAWLIVTASWSNPGDGSQLILLVVLCLVIGSAAGANASDVSWSEMVRDLQWAAHHCGEFDEARRPESRGFRRFFNVRLRRPRYKGKYQGAMWKR